MRPVTTALNNALLRSDGAQFRWLITIASTTGGARHFSADAQSVGGVQYIGDLLSISPMYEAVDSVGDVTLEVADNASNRAAIVLAAEITIALWAIGTTAADMSILFHGELSDPITRHAGKISMDAVSFANLGDRMMGAPLSITDYPGADPNAIGQIKPIIYGSVQSAPCLAIDAGSITTLTHPVLVGDLVAMVTATAAFPASGTVQIDNETITYSAKTAVSITIAAATLAHDKGAQLAEIQSQYDYLIADHPIRAVSNVYVDQVRQLGSDFTIILDDHVDHKAKIRFTTLPTLIRQVNLVADASGMSYATNVNLVDGIEVLDDIKTSASQSLHDHTTGGTQQSTSAAVPFNASQPFAPFSFGTQVTFGIPAGSGTITYHITANTNHNYHFKVLTTAGILLLDLMTDTVNHSFSTTQVDFYVQTSGWATVTEFSATWTIAGNLTTSRAPVISTTKSGGAYKSGTGITTNPTTTASGNIVLTGNSVADTKIGGLVTVDCEGYADDAAGSITGTANAPIMRPDLVARHLLITYGGVATVRASTADFNAFVGETLSIHLRGVVAVRSVIADIARQSRAIITYSSARWIMRQRPTPATTPIATISDADTMRLESGASTAVEGVTGLRRLKNRHRWRCGKSPSGQGWAAADVVNSTISQGRYGVREEVVDLDFVPTSPQAIALAAWLAARESNPLRKVIHMQLMLNRYPLEVGDAVQITNVAAGIDIGGDIINIGPRVLSGRGNGSMTITIEEA